MAIAQKAPKAVSAEDDEGNQPLSQCYGGETVDMLIKLGADPRHKNEEGRTALHVTGTRHLFPLLFYGSKLGALL